MTWQIKATRRVASRTAMTFTWKSILRLSGESKSFQPSDHPISSFSSVTFSSSNLRDAGMGEGRAWIRRCVDLEIKRLRLEAVAPSTA